MRISSHALAFTLLAVAGPPAAAASFYNDPLRHR